MQMADDMLQ